MFTRLLNEAIQHMACLAPIFLNIGFMFMDVASQGERFWPLLWEEAIEDTKGRVSNSCRLCGLYQIPPRVRVEMQCSFTGCTHLNLQ